MKFVDVETIRKTNLFLNEELTEIQKQRNNGEISLAPIAAMTDWKMGDLKSEIIFIKINLEDCWSLSLAYSHYRYSTGSRSYETSAHFLYECQCCSKTFGQTNGN